MSLKDDLPKITKLYQDSQNRLAHNKSLFDIYEGDLLSYVLASLKAMLSEESFQQAQSHVAPINVLKRMIDKLSKIYAKPPVRKFSAGATDNDQSLFDELYTEMDANTCMGQANEFFNLFKNDMVEPFLDKGTPRLRIVPSDRFLVYSDDRVNPLRPTHYSKIMCVEQIGDKQKVVFYTYTDTEFLIHDQDNVVLKELMDQAESTGENPYGKIPGVYINRSRHSLIPKIDSDTLCMTLLIPILLSDVNYAIKFQCFSIIYGINVTSENLKLAPNVFWNLKASGDGEVKPEVGTIKPSVDSDKALNLIKTQLAFWMQTRNIKPGAIGDLTLENASSGIAKMVDEMDTSEDRQKQVPFFMTAEKELAELLMYHMHPVWTKDADYKLMKSEFTQGLTVTANFAEQRAMIDSTKVLTDEVTKLTNKLTTRKRALKTLNPDMDDEAIETLLEEIDEESGAMPKDGPPDAADQMDNGGDTGMDESELEQQAPTTGSKR